MQFNSLRLLLSWFLVVFILAGCLAPQNQGGSTDIVAIAGKVSYKDFEGGFWAIDGNDGNKYNPLNLPDSFQKNNLKVQVTAIPHPEIMSLQMYGIIIEIIDISKSSSIQ